MQFLLLIATIRKFVVGPRLVATTIKLFLTNNFPCLWLYDNATNSAYSSFAANI
jgi:hypothetical protein